MATTLVDTLKWYGPSAKGYPAQTIPTPEQLEVWGAKVTGYTIAEYDGYDPETEALPEGRDTRTWVAWSPLVHVNVIVIPDQHGFYVEDFNGQQWRPADLEQLRALFEEMDHQVSRYGGLL